MISRLIFFIFGLVFIQQAAANKLSCSFTYYTWEYVGDIHYCNVKSLKVDANNRNIDDVSINYYPRKSYQDVAGVWAENKNIPELPDNFIEYFPNIRAFYFNECKVKRLRQDNFGPFGGKLEYVNFGNNEIERIDKNLFSNNPNLRAIVLNNNRIKFIDKNVFDNLPNLYTLGVYGNVCTKNLQTGDTYKRFDETKKHAAEVIKKCSKK